MIRICDLRTPERTMRKPIEPPGGSSYETFVERLAGLVLAAVAPAARRPGRPRRSNGPAPGPPTTRSARSRSCTRGGSSRWTPSPARRSSRSTAARPSPCATPRRKSRSILDPAAAEKAGRQVEGREMGPGRRIPGLDRPSRVLGRPAVHPRRLPAAPPADLAGTIQSRLKAIADKPTHLRREGPPARARRSSEPDGQAH